MVKERIKKIPIIGKLALSIYTRLFVRPRFTDSASYWEKRYKSGGNSGVGSYHRAAEYKGEIINPFIKENAVKTVIEFGCGDGNQLQYFEFPSYVGFDVSETAISRCRNIFQSDPTKRFELLSSYANEKAELALSLDVIYHLVEDTVFQSYMETLFSASDKYVIIYSNDTNDNDYMPKAAHVRNRKFTDWVQNNAGNFQLLNHMPPRFLPNGEDPKICITDFYIYQKKI